MHTLQKLRKPVIENLVHSGWNIFYRLGAYLRSKRLCLFFVIIITSIAIYAGSKSMTLALALAAVAYLAFRYPRMGLYLLSLYIPLKYVLNDTINIRGISLFIVPVVILFVFLGGVSMEKVNTSKIDVLFLLIFIAGLISTAGNVILYGLRINALLDFMVWLQLVGFYLAGRVLLREEHFEKFVVINLVIANVISAIGLAMVMLSPKGYQPWIESYESITYRVTSTLGNPNALAGYLLIIILMALVYLFNQKRKIFTSQLTLLCALPTLALFLTFSRGAILVFILAVLLLLVTKKRFKTIAVLLVFIALVFVLSPSSYKSRFSNIFSQEHLTFSADSGRVWALNNVFYINRNHFLFGSGWGSYGGEYAYKPLSPTYLEGVQGGNVTVPNTDNQWLQIYAQQGIVGVWLYLLIMYELFITTGDKKRFIPVLAIFTLGLFIDVFQFYQISFLGFMLLGGLSVSDRLPLKKNQPVIQ